MKERLSMKETELKLKVNQKCMEKERIEKKDEIKDKAKDGK